MDAFNALVKVLRAVLPAEARRIGRQLLTRSSSTQWSIDYQIVPGWPTTTQSFSTPEVRERLKKGLETFDVGVALENPIVRDNLTILGMTGLSEATLLDFGCGNGIYCRLLAAFPTTSRWKYVGADIDAEMITWCRTRHPGVRFELIEDNGAKVFRDNEFDLVLASGVVQYINEYTEAFSELHRIVRDRILVSRLPLWKYHPSEIVLQHVRHEWGEEHHPMHVFNRDTLNLLFTRLGFLPVFQDYGSEFFHVPAIAEPVVFNSYLLKKIQLQR